MKFFNCLKNKRAQIVLPAILLIPTILLVIYLLFETAKLSRFKVRNQFALDSAAFIELTSYSTFLNAIAYTNGAFPYRFFSENMTYRIPKEEDDEYEGGPGETVSYYQLFYEAGAFPAIGEEMDNQPEDQAGRWELRYREIPGENDEKTEVEEGKGRPKSWNTENPEVEDSWAYAVNKKEYVEHYKYVISSKDDDEEEPSQEEKEDDSNIINPLILYISAYKQFESIYESQRKVYDRLAESAEMFRKSYFYNSSSCKLSQCGREGAKTFQDFAVNMEPIRLKKIRWHWRGESQTTPGFMTFGDEEKYNKFMPLYQFAYLDKVSRAKMKKIYTGIDIWEPIVPPDNYFKVNVKRYAKKLHVRAALQCTNESNNCVWPNPTPKYQVRLFP